MKLKFLVVSLFFLVWVDLASGFDFQTCDNCHSSLQEDYQKPFIHSPFNEGLCEECHVIDVESLAPEDQRIDWLGEDPFPAKTHHFRIPDSELGEILVTEIKSSYGPSTREEIPVPSLHEVQHIEDSGAAPIISTPGLVSLDQGVFLTATVGWETDKLADASIQYGKDDLSNNLSISTRIGREHFVVIRNLAPDETYQFVAISNDIFGRKTQSRPVTFSTAIDANQAHFEKSESAEISESVATKFSRIDDVYLIEVQLAQENQILLGTKGRKTACLPEDEFHSGLNCVENTLTSLCLNCHQAHDHPVGVVPRKKGVRIPEDFPTLPGGQIACASCHSPHSSRHYSLTRKDSRKSLCASCHMKWSR